MKKRLESIEKATGAPCEVKSEEPKTEVDTLKAKVEKLEAEKRKSEQDAERARKDKEAAEDAIELAKIKEEYPSLADMPRKKRQELLDELQTAYESVKKRMTAYELRGDTSSRTYIDDKKCADETLEIRTKALETHKQLWKLERKACYCQYDHYYIDSTAWLGSREPTKIERGIHCSSCGGYGRYLSVHDIEIVT